MRAMADAAMAENPNENSNYSAVVVVVVAIVVVVDDGYYAVVATAPASHFPRPSLC